MFSKQTRISQQMFSFFDVLISLQLLTELSISSISISSSSVPTSLIEPVSSCNFPNSIPPIDCLANIFNIS